MEPVPLKSKEDVSPWLPYLVIFLLLAALVLAFMLVKLEMEARQTVTNNAELELKQAEADAKINPKDITKQLLLAQKYYENGQLQDAAETYQQIIKGSPHNFPAQFGMGLVFEKAGDYRQALRNFEKALAIKADDANALYHAGFCSNRARDFNKTVVYLEKAIAVEPMISSFHYELGIAYENLGKKSQAKLEFEEALRYNPTDDLSQKELEKLE